MHISELHLIVFAQLLRYFFPSHRHVGFLSLSDILVSGYDAAVILHTPICKGYTGKILVFYITLNK